MWLQYIEQQLSDLNWYLFGPARKARIKKQIFMPTQWGLSFMYTHLILYSWYSCTNILLFRAPGHEIWRNYVVGIFGAGVFNWTYLKNKWKINTFLKNQSKFNLCSIKNLQKSNYISTSSKNKLFFNATSY